jgi:pimeloyl-ACP methyl ester carboxylesterase/DNA-binding CsgD family transcriptional regulator
MEKKTRQRIRYLTTKDGVKVAWAEAGEGQVVVKAANWLTHLEHEWQSPVWKHWIRFFADNFHFIRYDERGCGMTERHTGELRFDHWVEDLEAVVEAAAPTEPFTLLGISQGAAVSIAFAVRHPELVSRVVLYGGYARGWGKRGDSEGAREHQAIVDLAPSWGRDNPAFRRVFTSRFIPGATEQQHAWFAELCRTTTPPDVAAEILRTRAEVDVTDLLDQVRAPTLVVHSRDDQVCPIAEGRLLASAIPGAEFLELDSRNHVLLDGEPAWDVFQGAVREFMGVGEADSHSQEDPAFANLSAREREILSLLTEGLANADIAERLSVSEKTVRNHVSNLFDKLGVWTRAQAIVFARDRGFRG